MKKMQILSVSVSGLAALIVAAPEVSANLNKQAVFIDDGSDEQFLLMTVRMSYLSTHTRMIAFVRHTLCPNRPLFYHNQPIHPKNRKHRA